MRSISNLIILLVMLNRCLAPPPPGSPDKTNRDSDLLGDYERYLDYYSYMKNVVLTLESDPNFREIALQGDDEFRRSVKLADHLKSTNEHTMAKLHILKRRELDRLRHLATKKYKLSNKMKMNSRKVPSHDHVDASNPYTFEMEDLKKLIQKTLKDVKTIDDLRRQQFKEYEMQKEFERRNKLEKMTESEKKEFIKKENQEKEAKKHHKPLHHPGSKQQYEEVWKKQDHMDQKFDPKAFFMMHDLDGNGIWDADELKALFVKELDKVYGAGGPNKDMRERAEEMERMREHVYRENDLNHDGVLDYDEFLQGVVGHTASKDDGWKTIDEEQIFTPSEYQEYQNRLIEMMKYLNERGIVNERGHVLPGKEELYHRAQLEFAAQYRPQTNQVGQKPQEQLQGQFQQQSLQGQQPSSEKLPAPEEFHVKQPTQAQDVPVQSSNLNR